MDNLLLTERGWLFVGRDGLLYRAEYDDTNADWYDNPYCSSWDVSQVVTEWWGRAYPPPEHDRF